jgi:hypothetical protein
MAVDLIGRNNGTGISLGYSHVSALTAVLSELSGKRVDLLKAPISDSQSKSWATILRNNLPRIRLIKGRRIGFLVLEGTDIKREFSTGQYKNDVIEFQPTWDLAQPLDRDWTDIVEGFIKFLDSCGGIIDVIL